MPSEQERIEGAPSGTGSREQHPSAAALTGFDPSREFVQKAIAALGRADEELASLGYWSEGATRKPLWDAETALKALLFDLDGTASGFDPSRSPDEVLRWADQFLEGDGEPTRKSFRCLRDALREALS